MAAWSGKDNQCWGAAKSTFEMSNNEAVKILLPNIPFRYFYYVFCVAFPILYFILQRASLIYPSLSNSSASSAFKTQNETDDQSSWWIVAGCERDSLLLIPFYYYLYIILALYLRSRVLLLSLARSSLAWGRKSQILVWLNEEIACDTFRRDADSNDDVDEVNNSLNSKTSS